MVNIYMSMATFCIPSFIKSNHNRGWNLAHWISLVRRVITILAGWLVCTKVIAIVSTNNVVKRLVEALTYYSNFLRFLLLFVTVFLLNEVVALRNLRQTTLQWLKIMDLSYNQVTFFFLATVPWGVSKLWYVYIPTSHRYPYGPRIHC